MTILDCWLFLQQILTDLNIDYQVSQKSIIIGIQNAPISVELIVTVIAHLLARKCRPKSLNSDRIKREITSLMKTEDFIAKKWGKIDNHNIKWEIFESLKGRLLVDGFTLAILMFTVHTTIFGHIWLIINNTILMSL
jgi:hypothetical protein